jgi:phosphatidylglycerophosphate synthase
VLIALVLVTLAAVVARAALALSGRYAVAVPAVFATVAVPALVGIGRYHPYPRVGAANMITCVRAALTALAAGALVEIPTASLGWALVVAASAAVALDGLDGWAARRQRLSSAFGARFDLEVDALLILVLSALAWRFGKAGAWVLASGLMRYAFVAAGWALPWFNRPLPPSRRRQAVCVAQIAGLVVALAPIVPSTLSAGIAAVSLVVLTWSFWLDVAWLAARRHHGLLDLG